MIEKIILEHIDVSNALLNQVNDIEKICIMSYETIKSGNKILICGNGGSASDASHIAAEFVGKFERARKPLPAISLSENISSITSIGNDFSFDKIFSKQIQAIGSKDCLLYTSPSPRDSTLSRMPSSA